MAHHRRIIAGGIAGMLVVAACSPPAGTTAEPTSTTEPTTTTSQPVTTTSTTVVATTTTTRPIARVTVSGDVDPEILSVVTGFVSSIQDPRNGGDIDPDLAAHYAGLAGVLPDHFEAAASTRELSTGGAVGVVTLDTGDIILIADEGSGWTAVGADLGSFEATPWFGPTPHRVLVLGSDARPGQDPPTFRMDSIHILTANVPERAGTILGYPRDSYVTTEFGEMRINALTTSGRGPEALLSFFTDDWDIPLDGYILTGFSGFERLVAATIGRLVITIPRALPVQDWWAGFSSGTQTLSPTRTLDYARTRKRVPGGDLTRSHNQGIVMLAVLAMLREGSIDDAPALIGELVDHTFTNLSPTDLIQLAGAAFTLDPASIDNLVLPGSLGRGKGGTSVVFLDEAAPGIVADVIDNGVIDDSTG